MSEQESPLSSLKELVRLSKLATPGPWTKIGSAKRTLFTTAQGQQQVAPDKAFLPVEIITCLRHAEQAHADCDFIQVARNAIPSLEALLSRHEKLVATLELIKRGLESGSIRSKPILEFDPEAESCPVRALEDIVSEALSAIEGGPTA